MIDPRYMARPLELMPFTELGDPSPYATRPHVAWTSESERASRAREFADQWIARAERWLVEMGEQAAHHVAEYYRPEGMP